jgi:hypothetical protein
MDTTAIDKFPPYLCFPPRAKQDERVCEITPAASEFALLPASKYYTTARRKMQAFFSGLSWLI